MTTKMRRVRLRDDGDPIAPLIGRVVPERSTREIAVVWPDAEKPGMYDAEHDMCAVMFYQHAELIDVEKPREAKAGDHLRVLHPTAEFITWIGIVRKFFDDGACIIDPIQGWGGFEGAYILTDLTGFVHVDGAPIVPHPAIPCASLRGGHVRNPLDACLRCGDLG